MIRPHPFLLQRLREERSRSDRSGRPFSLILISMDNRDRDSSDAPSFFRALQNFSQCIRLPDCLGWYSGDRLGLILPEASEPDARKVAERLKDHIRGFHGDNPHTLIFQKDFLLILEYPKTLKDKFFDKVSYRSKGKDAPAVEDTGLDSFACPIESMFLDQTSLHASHGNKSLFARLDTFGRRCFDVFAAAVGLILVFPVMIAIAGLIKITSKGPVLFRQKRIGRGGKEFVFVKFRSMYHDCDENMHKEYVTRLIQNKAEQHVRNGYEYFKLVNDRRVTPFGKILRKTSLDELPQLFNVLKGEMSLVGPRPPIGYEVEKYQTWQLRRILETKPGITGLWQVSGRSSTTFDEQVRLDLNYVEKQSLWLNILILMKTFRAVLSMKGAC